MALFSYLYTMEIKDMQALIEENKRLQAQIEKLSAEKAVLEGKKIEFELLPLRCYYMSHVLRRMLTFFRILVQQQTDALQRIVQGICI